MSIPSECKRGALVKGWSSWQTISNTLTYSRNATDHADIHMSGSFCPLISGPYTITINGEHDSNYCHYYKFDTKTGNHSETLQLNLYQGKCYYFVIGSCAISHASVNMSVKIDGSSYIPTIPEIYSCRITDCINGGNYKNNCIKRYTCSCKFDNKVKYSIYIMCFIL